MFPSHDPFAASDIPPSVVYKPIKPLMPISLNCGFEDAASFVDIVRLLNVVLNISAGKDTKLPNGVLLNA